MLGAERSRHQLESGSCRHERWRQLGIRMNDIHLRKFSTAQRRGDGAPGCGRGWIQARNQETMALGLVEGDTSGTFFLQSQREKQDRNFAPPQAYHF